MQVFGISWQLAVLGLVGGSIAILLNMLTLVIIGKINETLPERERISYLNWTSTVYQQYRRIYPRGKLVLLIRIGELAMVVWFVVAVWLLASGVR
jgi:hypothetical protein